MKSHRSWTLAACLVAMSGAGGGLTPFACGQMTEAPKVEPTRLKVYKLRHLPSLSAAEELRQLFPSGVEDTVKIVPDLVTNALVVLARRPQHEMIAEVLEGIDVEAPQVPAPEITVFALKHARASGLMEVMRAVAADRGIRLAVDERTNSVIAVGPKEATAALTAVLDRFDEPLPHEEHPSQPLRMRVVWLIEGREHEKLPAPSADLRSVVDELTRLGLEDLGRVAQIVVNIDANNSPFQAEGNVDLGGKALRLSVEGGCGRREPASGQFRLNLSITVGRLDSDERLCSLSTDLTTSLGHNTVIGTTPLGQKSAVFVVQVLSPEK